MSNWAAYPVFPADDVLVCGDHALLPVAAPPLQPVEGVFLSNRGINFSTLQLDALHLWMVTSLTALLVIVLLLRRSARALKSQRLADVMRDPKLPLGLLVVILVLVAATATVDTPRIAGFNFRGGGSITPEVTAVFFGLTI